MLDDDDDDLPPMASPWPLFLGHVLGVLTHLVVGVGTVSMLLLGPSPHPAADLPLTTTRFWLGGIAGFSTLVAVFFSTLMALAAFRLITMFLRRAPDNLVRASFVVGVLVAHGIGCSAGVVGSGVAVFGTVFGEHGGPWTVTEEAVPNGP